MNRVYKQLPFQSAHKSLRCQRGVTLIELMVALALGLLITVAMLKVYVDASGLYRFNEGLARVQENGRFALEFIRRDARVAGFWGCYSEAPLINGVSSDSDAWPGQLPVDQPVGHITGSNDDGLNSADSITFRSASGSGTLVNAPMIVASDSISVNSVATITSGMAVLISDCDNGDIFQVTDTSGASLAHAAGTSSNNSADLSTAYASGSRVYQARQSTFCIAPGADTSQPSLRRLHNPSPGETCASDGNELVEGVENMQILYGEDADCEGANGDGTANRYVPISEASLVIDCIVSVRVSLLARSLNDNLTTTPSQVTYNGAPYPTTPDRYLRKVFTTTITLRNKAG
jgi:type IV pilus assembly protein PilW